MQIFRNTSRVIKNKQCDITEYRYFRTVCRQEQISEISLFTYYDISFDALLMCQDYRIAAYICRISADQDWVRHSRHLVLPAYINM